MKSWLEFNEIKKKKKEIKSSCIPVPAATMPHSAHTYIFIHIFHMFCAHTRGFVWENTWKKGKIEM